ncbi:MAG: aldehyde dehydrogenase family protein, partial [Ensifer adhaerens]
MNDMTMPAAKAERIRTLFHGFLPGSEIGSYVDGALVAGSGPEQDLTDPATGEVFTTFKDAGADIIDAAMEAATRAQREWIGMSASARGRVMNEIARRIRERAPELAELESRSAGRPIRDIRGEALRVAEMFEYYAGWCDKLHGEVIPVPTSHLNYIRHEPVGVVAQITP